jgi:RNA polymerase sigma factor (sigma-70 family)
MAASGSGRWSGAAYVDAAPRGASGDPSDDPTDRSHVHSPPPELRDLLASRDAAVCDAAWAALVARHSRLLLHMARLVMPDHEGALDAYAYVLEQLRRDDFRTLRGYVADDRSRFSTWLGTVARRSCVDFYRQRYGRPRGNGTAPRAGVERAFRQRLAGLVGVDVELTELADPKHDGPEEQLRATQLRDALGDALDRLPADDRLLLRLRFEDDLTAQTIASVVGLPSPFHVYRRLRSVCGELRRRLIARGIDGSAP